MPCLSHTGIPSQRDRDVDRQAREPYNRHKGTHLAERLPLFSDESVITMAQHGVSTLIGHHGCLRAAMVAGGVALVVLAVLVLTGGIAPLLAAAAFAALACGLAGLALVTLVAARFQRGLPAYQRLLNSPATVLVDLAPTGRVLVQGEDWAAVLDDAFRDQVIPAGQLVRVVGVANLRVIITPKVEDLLAQAGALPPLPRP